MENNSNDTLFGFTAITDMFTEQVGNNIHQEKPPDFKGKEGRRNKDCVLSATAPPAIQNMMSVIFQYI